MSEKQQAEDFDEADDDIIDSDEGESADLARLTREMDQTRKNSAKSGMAALRKLEQLAEQKRTRELTSDFDDYDID